MSLIAVTSSQGLSVLSSAVLRASHPDPAPTFTSALNPPSRIPSQCISWSPDASTVYVASGGSVSAYDSASGACLQEVVREGEGGIGGAKLGSMAVLQTQAGTGPVLAFARGARAVVFDSETRRTVHTVEGHKSSIFAMSLAHDQSLLATSSAETTIITNLVQQTNTVLRGAPPGVVAAAFHPTRRTILLILSPRGLHVFDTTKGGAPTRTIPIGKPEGGSGSIAFSPITPALVAIAVPGGGGRVLMLDIEKESSLVKKFTAEENVTAISFSHDGGSIIVGTEAGRVLQLNLRNMDKPAQAVVVDPTGGKIGGLAMVVGSAPKAAKTIPNNAAKLTTSTTTIAGARQATRPTRAESVTSTSTGGSVRIRSSVADLRTTATVASTLRSKPSMNLQTKSPETMRTAVTKSPDTLRHRASSVDLAGKAASPSASVRKTSPGTLRVKAGVESKARPSSMITANTGKERASVRIRPISLIGEKREGTAGGSPRAGAGTSEAPSPGMKTGRVSRESPIRRLDKEPMATPSLRRQTQTMPRRLTTDGGRPTLSQIFAQDDLGTPSVHSRSRSTSYSATPVAPRSAGPDQASAFNASDQSQGSNTPVTSRPALASTTPSYTPGPGAGVMTGGQTETTTPSYPLEERFLGGRNALEKENEKDRPRSRLGEERTRSRLGEERIRSRLAEEVITEDEGPNGQLGIEDRLHTRPLTTTNSDPILTETERPASRLFKDEIDRPSSRVSGVLGLGRPSGMMARKFSTDLRSTPELARAVSDSGALRERPESVESESVGGTRERFEGVLRERNRPDGVLRERPESVLSSRERPESIFRTDAVPRDRSRSGTPLSASGRTPGKRVGWIDEESPYIDGLHDAVRTPARPTKSALSQGSGSIDGSSDSSDSGRRNRALQVTPRRGLAAALGAEVYAGDGHTNSGGKGGQGRSSSLTQTQAQDLLRNIVSDVMFEFRQETKEDVRGLHLDLIRASRGWKTDLKQYLGDTLDELREVKEENTRLRAEIMRLKRGY